MIDRTKLKPITVHCMTKLKHFFQLEPLHFRYANLTVEPGPEMGFSLLFCSTQIVVWMPEALLQQTVVCLCLLCTVCVLNRAGYRLKMSDTGS